jgi:multisubunit Na+/H+ antiporter MnhG subunit
VSLKIVLVVLALFLVNPLGTHLIGKSELHIGRLKDVPVEDVTLKIEKDEKNEEKSFSEE